MNCVLKHLSLDPTFLENYSDETSHKHFIFKQCFNHQFIYAGPLGRDIYEVFT